MKYIGCPQFDDVVIITKLADKDNLSSYPHLKKELSKVINEYEHYKSVRGNLLKLNAPLAIKQKLKDGLVEDYSRKLVDLTYIRKIRYELSPLVCPMCGSPSRSQVDHLAPKAEYPEFAIFSLNLVPACSCNGKKGVATTLGKMGRILHPYFDRKILSERLVYVEFNGDAEFPDLEVRVVPKFRNNKAVNFHVNSIVCRTNILERSSGIWSKIKERPDIFFELEGKSGNISPAQVCLSIEKKLKYYDFFYGTPNNWDSMFYFGLIESGPVFLKYIKDRINFLHLNPA